MKNSRARKIPYLNYEVRSFEEYAIVAEMEESKNIIFKTTIEAIEDSLKKRKKSVDIFMLDSEHCVSLKLEDCEIPLKNAIEFFSKEGIEDYEICKKCTDLLEIIKDGREIRRKKTASRKCEDSRG